MHFCPAELERFVVGADATDIVRGELRFHRVPAKLRAAYDDPPRFGVRRDCPSGVRLRFRSDSTRVELELRYGKPAEALFTGATVVDRGTPAGFGPRGVVAQWRGSVFEQSSPTARLLDLWMPHLVNANVTGLWFDDGCTVFPAPSMPGRWLALGDSITQGFCGTHPTSTAVARCALALDLEVHNLAVGGSTLKHELAGSMPEGDFDLVTIAYGACDFQENVALDTFLQNATRLIDTVYDKWPQAAIILVTPLLWPASPSSPMRNALRLSPQDYRDALRSLALLRPFIHVIPGESMIDPDPRLFFDWIHPNDEGFAQYAENLLPHLRAALAVKAPVDICMEGRCV